MSNTMREAFETRFPVPDGVCWSGKKYIPDPKLDNKYERRRNFRIAKKHNKLFGVWRAALRQAQPKPHKITQSDGQRFEKWWNSRPELRTRDEHSVAWSSYQQGVRDGLEHAGRDTQPPAPVVPEKREWNQAAGRDGFKYTNGWNDCRETMLNATPKPSNSEADQ